MSRWANGFWTGSRHLLNAEVTTKVKHLVGTCVVGFAVVGLVFHMIQQNGAEDRARDRRANAQRSYEVELRAYDGQVVQYESCVSRLESRRDLIVMLKGQNEAARGQNNAIRTILDISSEAGRAAGRPASPVLEQAYAALAGQDDLVNAQELRIQAYEANTPTACESPPPAPAPPTD